MTLLSRLDERVFIGPVKSRAHPTMRIEQHKGSATAFGRTCRGRRRRRSKPGSEPL
ncbi:protein of unknown function [Nitrospira japonica]|uniref:Uncharacterized protein n=1 Tax=Nitrospira japonica TaxID=1325564 RepID=A0A1W1I6G6_9BACT|nr:protein of unknown function [Nitrospira japonica]